jgi:DNA repair protein RecN (Recombination protein N)
MSDLPLAERATAAKIGHNAFMLSYLRVRGLALLQDATLELEPGFNVVTGETGAGKSLVVDGRGGARARHRVAAWCGR